MTTTDLVRFEPDHVEALTTSGPYHHTPSGMLYAKAADYDPAIAEVWLDGTYLRLRLPAPSAPKTIDQWRQQIAAQEAAAAAADEERRRRLRAGRRPVHLADVTGDDLPTLAAAYGWLLDREALITVDDGRLRVEVSPGAGTTLGLPAVFGANQLRNALRVVYAAERLVVAHLETGAELPDAPLDPTGRPIR